VTWTTREIAHLRRCHADGMTRSVAAAALGRTDDAVSCKAGELGLIFADRPTYPRPAEASLLGWIVSDYHDPKAAVRAAEKRRTKENK
jgi:hypothetical protein